MQKVVLEDLELLKQIVDSNDTILWGAGRVAHYTVKFLSQENVKKPICVLVSSYMDNPHDVFGLSVVKSTDFKSETNDKILLCCVLEEFFDELEDKLSLYEFKKIYCISNNLYNELKYKNINLDIENQFEIKKMQRQVEENQAKLIKNIPKPCIEYMIVNILDHCNLRCKGCDHFACVADEYFVSYESICNDLKRMEELFEGKYINKIAVMGGEPLLHPDLLKILIEVRKRFPYSTIRLTTNGLLLLQQEQLFWDVLRENNITIVCTKYPINLRHDLIEERAQNEKVKFHYFEGTGNDFVKKSFKKNIDLSGCGNPVDNWVQCGISSIVAFLMEGKIYPCPFSCQSYRIFNDKFQQDLLMVEDDYIDIYKIKSKQQILDYMVKPKYYCRYCTKGNTNLQPWTKSKQKIDEWVDV